MRRAIFDVTVAGTNITTALLPILISMSITDNAGTQSDSASIEIDDTGGRIILPRPKALVRIALGWSGASVREVFVGTVDGARSSGSRNAGRTLSIQAMGVDTTGRAKEGQQRHFDGQTVEAILRAAGEPAGITEVDVDPALASIVLPYIDMRDESFLHLGQRLARDLGGGFRIQGNRATLARRAGGYTPFVIAAFGDNLHSWSITPAIGRGAHKGARARAYDREKAEEVMVTATSSVDFSDAEFARRELLADKDMAQRAADGDAATATEMQGGGSIVIEGTTEAVPDGLCVLTGARAGIDGAYRIKTATHNIDRSGGWTTTLEVAEPQGGAGNDTRLDGGA